MKKYWDAFDSDWEAIRYMPITSGIALHTATAILAYFRIRYLTLMAYQAAFRWEDDDNPK